jgi:glycosyltransferase involved in cell wall biosynthesis
MARCLLDGLRRAALVFYSTEVVREQILEAGLVPSERLVHAPYGTAPEFSPEPDDWDSRVRQRLPGRFLLHVGSCIPRKNTALLLRLLARLRQDLPDLGLLQVGGAWPEAQRALLGELGLTHAVLQLRDVPRAELAAMYRQAEVVLLPSHAEGFGLPLIEALACGAKVLATRLPVFLEVGGTAAHYAASDDLEAWTTASQKLLSLRAHSGQEQCARAARYSWEKHAELVVGAYRRLACESAAVRA